MSIVRAVARPHARGSRLDVYTELFVYVGASRRSCQFFIYVGAPLGPDLGVVQSPYYIYYSADKGLDQTAGMCMLIRVFFAHIYAFLHSTSVFRLISHSDKRGTCNDRDNMWTSIALLEDSGW